MREGLVKMSTQQVNMAIFAAVEFTQDVGKAGRMKGLTHDRVAALNLHTMASPFYKVLNALLRDVDRSLLKPFFPFLRLILTAARRLPKENSCRPS